MTDQDIVFLKELVEAPSPSGFEQPAQRIVRRELETLSHGLRTDVMGNVIARIDGRSASRPRVMMAGHCDEIGLMVKYIDENGFIFFAPIGGVDAHLVPGQRVNIHGRKGPVLGVVGKKPIHMTDPKERETVCPLKNQFIDIGCSGREDAADLVAVGDPGTFAVGMERLQGDRVISRAFDDKMGAFIVTRVAKQLAQRGGAPGDFHAVSTVQEEVGLRGATTSTYGIDPDVGIVVEVGHATDFPDVDKREIGQIEIGKGPVISRGPNINPALFALLVETAEAENIPFQVMAEARGTGTDANVMQLSRGGVATALIRIPLRYMHTPVEMLCLADLDATIDLLTAAVCRIDDAEMFIPV